jgi:hypothetical protein
MKLYQVSIGGIGPHSRLKYCTVINNSIEIKNCSICFRQYEINHGTDYVLDGISEEGTKWPDFVMATGCYEACVRQRVIDGLNTHGIRGWESVPVRVPEYTLSGDLISQHLLTNTRNGEPIPQLYILHSLQYWGKLDLEASGLGGSEYCPECGKTMPPISEPIRLIIDESSFDWDAGDFFRFHPWGQIGLHVTKRVIEIARTEKWTGVKFIPLGVPYDVTSRVRSAIDPLSKQWPPKENWD